MIKVRITNFQSISSLEMDFEGFTTIVGRNFIGKSATLRAIDAALTNRQGTDFIRWGEKYCEVHIIMKGYDILWHKEPSNSFYIINKVRYDKIGKDEPPEPIKEAGFSLIKLGSDKVNLNYAEQFFPLFLIDRQDTKGADLLTSVFGLDKIYKAVELCGKDQKILKDDLRVRTGDLTAIDEDLLRFEGIKDLIEKSKLLKIEKKVLEDYEATLSSLKKLDASLMKIYRECNVLRVAEGISIPDSGTLNSEIEDLKTLELFEKSIRTLNSEIKRLQHLDSVELSDEESADILSDDIRAVSTLSTLSTRFKSLSEEIESLCTVESYIVPESDLIAKDSLSLSSLRDLFDRMIKAKKSVDSYSSISDIEIPSMDEVDDSISTLKKLRSALIEIGLEVKALEKEIEESSDDLGSIEKDLASYDTCPLCGKGVDCCE